MPKIQLVKDTLIEAVRYKMAIKFIKDTLPDYTVIEEPFIIYYLNLDSKNTFFTLNHFLTDSLGYPVTRIDLLDQYKVSGKNSD